MIAPEMLGPVADLPRHAAARWGTAPAIRFDGRDISFAELDARADRVARGLIEAGVMPGERVAYLGKNHPAFYEVLFGAARVRAAITGINHRLAAPEIAYILNDCGAQVLFVGKEQEPLIEQIIQECPKLMLIVAIHGGHTVWPDYPHWRDSQPARPVERVPEADDDVLQLYTSGTTGRPKGVMLSNATYGAFLDMASAMEWAGYQADDRVMLAMPVFHVAGANAGLLTVSQGAVCVMLPEVNPQLILETLGQERIRHAFFVPAVILMLLQTPGVETADFSNLYQIFYGASPISEALLAQAKARFGCRFTQLYGLTETAGAGTFLPPEAHDPAWGKLRSCGVPWPGVIIRCLDASGQPVPQGEVGEIAIHSPVVMKGYWQRPEATTEVMEGGWFRTGDAGYIDADGFLFIYDRVKDMIVSGGENVYPAEVENALFGHPAVADVAVIGVPDERWGEVPKAIVVCKPGVDLRPDELMGYARERIAAFKVPRSVDFAEALPRNASGKILRKDLREPFWRGHTRRVS